VPAVAAVQQLELALAIDVAAAGAEGRRAAPAPGHEDPRPGAPGLTDSNRADIGCAAASARRAGALCG
jgi:hypothetical protein